MINAAARTLGLTLTYVHIADSGAVDAGFRKFADAGVQAVLLTLTSTRNGLDKEYAQAALKYKLPSMSEFGYGAQFGGLMSYGPDASDMFRRAGHYVGRILKGEKPAEMAIREPERFHLAVNLKTAKALGVTLPQGVLVLADEVIE
mgnify:CR=1 FL=1